MNIPPIMSNLLVPLLVAVITAWVTVRLSLKKFRTERWWELKAEAYRELFEALYNTDVLWRQLTRQHVTDSLLDEDAATELMDKVRAAGHVIDKAIFLGEFIIDKQAVTVLQSLGRGLRIDEAAKAFISKLGKSPEEYYAEQRKHLDTIKTRLQEIARSDLGAG